jgi:MFS family permease
MPASNTVDAIKRAIMNKQSEVTAFSSTAIALYGYDQGMMSLINTNYSYLATMGIKEEDPMVAVIVSIYYIGCAIGSIIASWLADKKGRKPGMFLCLLLSVLGNFLMFISGLGFSNGAIIVMLVGRFIMGLGVGGLDAVVPVYSSELNESDNRGRALAQEFQANILGLNLAFGINILVTRLLGKENQWAWRTPIIAMQVFPLALVLYIFRLPESPRWYIFKEKDDKAKAALADIYDEEDVDGEMKELKRSRDDADSQKVGYTDMLFPGGSQFHPTMLTIMGQVNQALTGYVKST